MIEATCGACGTVNRIGEGDVPVGAKYIACSSCKSRVGIPQQSSSGLTLGGPPPAGGNRGDVIDLADLPAPKKKSALAGVDKLDQLSAKPARAPVDLDDLLAPPGSSEAKRAAAQVSDLPAPKAPKGGPMMAAPAREQSIDDLPQARSSGMGLGQAGPGSRQSIEDLPAPKAGVVGLGAAGAPRQQPGVVSDLPAPKSTRGIGDTNAPRGPSGISDLPAPKAASGFVEGAARPAVPMDLPAPKGARPSAMPPPRPPAVPPPRPSAPSISDLPAPKAQTQVGYTDLPAPKGQPQAGYSDLPIPKAQPSYGDLPAPKTQAGYGDLPAPKGPSSGFSDLPMPKTQAGYGDLPMPKPGGGGLSDLPTPKGPGGADLPAPKGFFDDLPMPSGGGGGSPQLPAPKGFFDDLPMPATGGGTAQLPAPKGFFDDLPQSAGGGSQQNNVAPKGFFDDLPQAAGGGSQQNNIAPKGFFDDIPQAKSAAGVGGLFDDIEPQGQQRAKSVSSSPLDFGGGGNPDLDLGPAMVSSPIPPTAGSYDDLDLSSPTTGPAARFETPKSQSQSMPRQDGMAAQLLKHGTNMDNVQSFEIEGEQKHAATPKLAPKKAAPIVDKVAQKKKQRNTRIVLGVVLGVVAVGAGGTALYMKHAAAEAKQHDIDDFVANAQAAMNSPSANHWQAAYGQAKQALELNEDEPRAIGIAAEAAYAGALDDGVNALARESQARNLLQHARETELLGPEIDRALIVESIAAKQWDRAITKLQPLVAANPKDGFLELYYGWALSGRGDTDGAIKAFDKAADANAALKGSALYGRALAKLASSDLEGAHTDFGAVIALDKDHIGAMVGQAAALPGSQLPQQEADLLAITQRKDFDAADPRARVQAWVLAGDDARRASRLDAARDRYNKALAITANDVSATTGLAETELRDGKLPLANELITKAATSAPNDVHAQLVAAEIEIRLGKLDTAAQRLDLVGQPERQLSPLDRSHLDLVQGRLLEAKDDDAGALEKWTQAAKLAGDLDLTPTIVVISKLGKLQQKALEDKNPDKAAEYRAKADALLAGLADKAANDPALALTLGTAYLDTGDAVKAETWLRRAADARPKDPDAKYQLAKALVRQTRADDAIDQLRAAIEIDTSRADIGLELAKTYEAAGRDPDAAVMYDKLLAGKEPSVELRARAGRFYARKGDIDKAGVQGDEILKIDAANAAGLFLRGEKLLAAGKLDDAKKAYQQAVDQDRDPQYLDGQGRCAEKIFEQTGDSKFLELALRAYQAASDAAPTMFNPLAGQGRVFMARQEWDKALKPLEDANQLQPDDLPVLVNMGLVLQKLNRNKEAVAWLQKANKAKPSFDASYHLAQMYLVQNDAKNAAASFEEAVKIGKDTIPPPVDDKEDEVADAYYELGQIYVANTFQNYSAAKHAYQNFLGRNPKHMQPRVDEAQHELSTQLKNVQ
jgi:tetratricopeptide (TPR) repeat protein|nr:tetratricopeptide repeat protein [Kofleriaceae bacterium]